MFTAYSALLGGVDESADYRQLPHDSLWKTCPVCSLLPLADAFESEEPKPLELHMYSNKLDPKLIPQRPSINGGGIEATGCGLCSLILELHNFWSKNPGASWTWKGSNTNEKSTCPRGRLTTSPNISPYYRSCSGFQTAMRNMICARRSRDQRCCLLGY
jgi:hypothetical protein